MNYNQMIAIDSVLNPSPPRPKKIVHGIVGYMQPEYIKNSIDAVLSQRLPNEHVYVLVTGGPRKDYFSLSEIYRGISDFNLRYVEPTVDTKVKTGGLYFSYNLLTSICIKQKVDYLNLIQSDLQLIYWNQDILDHYLALFQNFQDCVQINTGFIRKGSHPDAYLSPCLEYRKFRDDLLVPVLTSGGVGDWGFISIERWVHYGLDWSGTETSMAERTRSLGLSTPWCLLPCVAPVPWPATIRNNRQRGREIKRKGRLLLAPTRTFEELNATRNFFRWQEDWVVTDGYYSLEPVWATDISFDYLKINASFHKGITKVPFRYTSYGRKSRGILSFGFNRRPRYRDVFRSVMIGVCRCAWIWLRGRTRK